MTLWIELKGQQGKRLHKALTGSFNHASLSRLFIHDLGKSLTNAVGPDGFSAVVAKVIELARMEIWLDDLIVAASLKRPDDEDLRRLVGELGLGEEADGAKVEGEPRARPTILRIQLTGEQRGVLLKALGDLFDYQGLGVLLATKIEKKISDYIQPPAGMKDVAAVLVKKAEEMGWLHHLIAEAHEAREAHPGLAALHQEISTFHEFVEQDPFDAYLLHGRRAFVHRPNLRLHLRSLNKPLEDRILVVTGDRCSGKTYTKELVYYLEERLAGSEGESFKSLWVDLSHDEEDLAGEEPAPITALEIAEQIVGQISDVELSEKLERKFKEERDPRWGWGFCKWLTGELADSNTVYWLLLDGFEESVLEEGARELIEALAAHVANNLRSLRLLLLGYDGGLQHVGDRSFWDEIEDFTETERSKKAILPFLYHLHLLKGEARDEDELLEKITNDVKEILGGIDPEDPERLRALGTALSTKAREMLGR